MSRYDYDESLILHHQQRRKTRASWGNTAHRGNTAQLYISIPDRHFEFKLVANFQPRFIVAWTVFVEEGPVDFGTTLWAPQSTHTYKWNDLRFNYYLYLLGESNQVPTKQDQIQGGNK